VEKRPSHDFLWEKNDRENPSFSFLVPFKREGYNGTNFQSEIQKRRKVMVKFALFVRLEAKPGKEAEVESFLKGGLNIVQDEPATTAWFAIRLGPSTFGIFDAFPDEAGRQAHLSGRVAQALMAKASELLASPPVIEKVGVLAAKLPG
jgi:quinol monooxygenase YgiN